MRTNGMSARRQPAASTAACRLSRSRRRATASGCSRISPSRTERAPTSDIIPAPYHPADGKVANASYGNCSSGGCAVGVKEQMLQILGSDETRRVHFGFRGTNGSQITVDRTSFRRVANALSSGQIGIVENRFTSDIAMYSAFADLSSNSAANTFYLGRNPRWSRAFNALIVHESVHASFDLTHSTIPWVDNEAAAYIAQGYYL